MTCNTLRFVLALCLLGWLPGRAAAQAEFATEFFLEDCSWSSTGENRFYLSLNPGDSWTFEGEEDGESLDLVITVLDETLQLPLPAEGGGEQLVTTRIIEEREWEDDELVEVSRNFFARCRETDSIYYFGEDVDDYEDGVIVGHEGAWRVGEDGALPGLIMPGTFVPGAAYVQERGVEAQDRAWHQGMGLAIDLDAGSFDDCVEVWETSPLEPGSVSEKIYCPGVGMVVDDELELVSFDRTPDAPADNLLPGDLTPGQLSPEGRWEIDGDGQIDVTDVVALLRAAVGVHVLAPAP